MRSIIATTLLLAATTGCSGDEALASVRYAPPSDFPLGVEHLAMRVVDNGRSSDLPSSHVGFGQREPYEFGTSTHGTLAVVFTLDSGTQASEGTVEVPLRADR